MRTTSGVLHIQVYIGKVKLNLSIRDFKKVGFQLLLKMLHFSIFVSNGSEFQILGPAAEKDDLRVCVFLQKSEFMFSDLGGLSGLSWCLVGNSSWRYTGALLFLHPCMILAILYVILSLIFSQCYDFRWWVMWSCFLSWKITLHAIFWIHCSLSIWQSGVQPVR